MWLPPRLKSEASSAVSNSSRIRSFDILRCVPAPPRRIAANSELILLICIIMNLNRWEGYIIRFRCSDGSQCKTSGRTKCRREKISYFSHQNRPAYRNDRVYINKETAKTADKQEDALMPFLHRWSSNFIITIYLTPASSTETIQRQRQEKEETTFEKSFYIRSINFIYNNCLWVD